MAERKDYYRILGVDKDAEADEIKRAYRKLAREHHPDVNPDDPAAEGRFKEISEAYHVLSDPERRRQYDQVGPEAFAQEFDLSDFADSFRTVFRGGGGRSGRAGDFGFLEDLFGAGGPFGGGGGFGGRQAQQRPRKGRDVRVPVQLSFEEALDGGQRTVSYTDASGRRRTAKVKIPAGVRPGSSIRIRGKGEPGAAGGPAGDLYLQVTVAPHGTFELDGDDLRVTVPVTVYEAGLGGRIEIPTPNGSTRIELPPETRSGQVFRLRGKGAPTRDGGRGDLLARVRIELPATIDEPVAELLRQFRDQHPYRPRKEA